jgi:glutaredoxin
MRKYLDSYPHLVKEFDFEKNQPLTPKNLLHSSHKKVWWKCLKKHEWFAVVGNRTILGRSCPYCSGHKLTKENTLEYLFPKVAKEWHPTKNGNLKPEDVAKSSNKKVWWLCSKGHEWLAVVSNRTTLTSNCPHCFNIKRKLFSKKLN